MRPSFARRVNGYLELRFTLYRLWLVEPSAVFHTFPMPQVSALLRRDRAYGRGSWNLSLLFGPGDGVMRFCSRGGVPLSDFMLCEARYGTAGVCGKEIVAGAPIGCAGGEDLQTPVLVRGKAASEHALWSKSTTDAKQHHPATTGLLG